MEAETKRDMGEKRMNRRGTPTRNTGITQKGNGMMRSFLVATILLSALPVSADGYHPWSPHPLTITSVGGNGDVWNAVYLGLNDGTSIRLTQSDARNLINQIEASLRSTK